ncbi:MAG: SOS response-associated peptidase [Candidatus Marinimicrobia bacterium]|nr:SOS response-associated peptidase [Candidatus Neomarinimicrobiota bacterium]
MCGRKTLTKGKMEIIEELSIKDWDKSLDIQPNYNVAPTTIMPILLYNDGRVVRPMRWGLIPSWTKDASAVPILINARCESLTEKPSFRGLLDANRCIVITDGYYEWQKTTSGKQPFYIHHPQSRILTMAGLYSQWKDRDGQILLTYTVITTPASAELQFIHERMPAILTPPQIDTWIDCNHYDSKNALTLLQPSQMPLTPYPVSAFVNSIRNNSAQCLQPINLPPEQTSLLNE